MFDKIIGNEQIITTLKKMVKQNRTSHSYLFLGIQGIGKKIIAKEFAKMLLCIEEEKYCNKCKSCIEFNTNNNPDYIYIEPEENKIKIEQIRKLQKSIQEKPIISDKKIYIIDNADLMTKESQNCLLKTLEEPPKYAIIILIGSNEIAFLPTIKSRCTIIKFNKIEDEEIKKYLESNYRINTNENMIRIFQGSIGKAIKLKDKQQDYQILEKLIEEFNTKTLIDIFNEAKILYNSKDEIEDMLEYINILLLQKSKQNYLFTNCIKIVEDTKKRLKLNANYDMAVDNMLFNIWEEVN